LLYLVFTLIVAALYFACRSFAGIKEHGTPVATNVVLAGLNRVAVDRVPSAATSRLGVNGTPGCHLPYRTAATALGSWTDSWPADLELWEFRMAKPSPWNWSMAHRSVRRCLCMPLCELSLKTEGAANDRSIEKVAQNIRPFQRIDDFNQVLLR